MDDGSKSAELIFRFSLAIKEIILKTILKLLKAYIEHAEWLKQHNIKPGLKARIDKTQIKVVKITASLVEKQVEISKQKVINKEREIDKYKLDKQYELEEKYNVTLNKAKKALEIELGKEGKDKDFDKIKEKQLLVDQALEDKRKFEYETNKEILAKNHELDNYKNELSNCENDLKVCNAKLNALCSHQNIESGRLKREYEDIAYKYLDENKEENLSNNETFETKKEDIISKIDDEVSKEKIGKDINELEKICKDAKKSIDKNIEHNYESDEYYENLDNNIDKLSQIYEYTEKDIDSLKLNNEDMDKVAQMLSKDPEALKSYQEKKEKGDFKLNANDKNIEVERG